MRILVKLVSAEVVDEVRTMEDGERQTEIRASHKKTDYPGIQSR